MLSSPGLSLWSSLRRRGAEKRPNATFYSVETAQWASQINLDANHLHASACKLGTPLHIFKQNNACEFLTVKSGAVASSSSSLSSTVCSKPRHTHWAPLHTPTSRPNFAVSRYTKENHLSYAYRVIAFWNDDDDGSSQSMLKTRQRPRSKKVFFPLLGFTGRRAKVSVCFLVLVLLDSRRDFHGYWS